MKLTYIKNKVRVTKCKKRGAVFYFSKKDDMQYHFSLCVYNAVKRHTFVYLLCQMQLSLLYPSAKICFLYKISLNNFWETCYFTR